MGRNNLRHKTLPIDLTQGLTDIAKVRLEHVVNKLSRDQSETIQDQTENETGLLVDVTEVEPALIPQGRLIAKLLKLRKYTNGQFSYILGWTDRILNDAELFIDQKRKHQEYVAAYKFLCRLGKAYAAQEGEDLITPRFFAIKKDPEKLLAEAHKIRVEQYKTKSYAGAGKN